MIKEFLSCYVRPTPHDVERRILQLVRHAWENVPFYREKMKAADIGPDDITCLRDFNAKFPITSSVEYRTFQQCNGTHSLLASGLAPEQLSEERSSGSSGVTISFYRGLQESKFNKARTLWHLVRAGLRPWHRTMTLVSPPYMVKRDSLLQAFGVFRRTTVNYTMPISEITAIIKIKKINAIYGQKSFLRLIAEHYLLGGEEAPRLEVLIPGAERVTDADRKLFREVFRPRVYREFYGSTETGLIAVKHGEDYEPDYKAVFFSLGEPEVEGGLTSGTLLVTSLGAFSQPILKYELGDRVRVRNYEKNLELGARIVEVEGRSNDYLIFPDGGKISGATFYASLHFFPYLRQFRIVQESRSNCTVLLKLSEANGQRIKEVEDVIRGLLRDKINYVIKYVDEIPMDPNGKTKILVSAIEQN